MQALYDCQQFFKVIPGLTLYELRTTVGLLMRLMLQMNWQGPILNSVNNVQTFYKST